MTSALRITRAQATDDDMRAVLGLIRQASGWLSGKGTDQWATPWPDETTRDHRVRRALEVGATWIVWAGQRATATITVGDKPSAAAVWRDADCYLDESAVYAHRLITDRQFAGWGLGAQLIDWAGLRAHQEYGAEWIRIDVWTTNLALHEYYMQRGFEPCGRTPDPDYPSGMLFEKPIAKITEPIPPLFVESGPAPDPFWSAAPSLTEMALDWPPRRQGLQDRDQGRLALCGEW
jgi:GNAT superfamily N-acetyltransferase